MENEYVQDVEAYLNEPVKIRLFRDNDRYRDRVYVAVNGRNCLIERGKWITVKRKFALVLDQSEIQDMCAATLAEAEQDRFRVAEAQMACGNNRRFPGNRPGLPAPAGRGANPAGTADYSARLRRERDT